MIFLIINRLQTFLITSALRLCQHPAVGAERRFNKLRSDRQSFLSSSPGSPHPLLPASL